MDGIVNQACDKVVLGAVGDIDLSGSAIQPMQTKGAAWPFEKVSDHLREADVLFGNFESVILPPDYPEEEIKSSAMASKFDPTPGIRAAGFDFLSLANNHRLDGGIAGMFHTQEAINRQGIATGGIGRTQEEARKLKTVTKNGFILGFLCYSKDSRYVLSSKGPCYAFFDEETIIEDIRANKGRVDFLILSIHADIEFARTPSVPRREAFRRFAAEGADVILAHHPHVPQGIELVDGSLIAYSLGNFVFPAHSCSYMKSHGPETAYSYLLLVDLGREGVKSFRRIPFIIDAHPEERPRPMKGREQEALEEYLKQLDHMVADDKIVMENWQRTAMQQFDSSLANMRRMDRRDLLVYELGLLLFGGANRDWVREVVKVIQANWERQQTREDLHHPPLHGISQSLQTPDCTRLFSRILIKSFRMLPLSAKMRIRGILEEALK